MKTLVYTRTANLNSNEIRYDPIWVEMPPVHCKDCKHHCQDGFCGQINAMCYTEDDDYCSRGEEK